MTYSPGLSWPYDSISLDLTGIKFNIAAIFLCVPPTTNPLYNDIVSFSLNQLRHIDSANHDSVSKFAGLACFENLTDS